MPISPRQFIGQMKQRRAAVTGLKTAAQTHGYSNAYHNAAGQIAPSGGFYGPSTGQRLNSAAGAAKSAGVSTRKINKVVGKATEIGNSYGKEHAAFGAGGKNPFRG
jgi:hypothetical protein